MTGTNPLLQPWTTPFGIPPFDRIRPEHFEPAFADAMAQHLAEIAAIAADPAPPTFANTLEALQRSGRLLTRIEAVFDNLAASLGGADLEAPACSPASTTCSKRATGSSSPRTRRACSNAPTSTRSAAAPPSTGPPSSG